MRCSSLYACSTSDSKAERKTNLSWTDLLEVLSFDTNCSSFSFPLNDISVCSPVKPHSFVELPRMAQNNMACVYIYHITEHLAAVILPHRERDPAQFSYRNFEPFSHPTDLIWSRVCIGLKLKPSPLLKKSHSNYIHYQLKDHKPCDW